MRVLPLAGHGRRPGVVLAALLVLLGVTACSHSASERAAASASPSPTVASPSSPAPSSLVARDPGPAVVLVRSVFAPAVTFRSPSGNLACRLSDGVICRAKEHAWASHASDPQTDCPAAKRFSGVQLGEQGLEERSDCYDVAESPGAVLAYGHGLELARVRCVSEVRGITCRDTRRGTGFSISRDTLSLTPWDGPLLRVPARSLDRGSVTVLPAGFDVTFVAGDHLGDCLLDDTRASCLVNSTAKAPPGDPSCELDQALTAEVVGGARGRLVHDCRSDANGGTEQLRAGRSVQVGDLRCTFGAGRLRCAHLAGARHGFDVGASSLRGF